MSNVQLGVKPGNEDTSQFSSLFQIEPLENSIAIVTCFTLGFNIRKKPPKTSHKHEWTYQDTLSNQRNLNLQQAPLHSRLTGADMTTDLPSPHPKFDRSTFQVAAPPTTPELHAYVLRT
jgi:hypothetical protein